MCSEWCSKEGHCGDARHHKQGGVDCRTVARCSKCVAGGKDDGGAYTSLLCRDNVLYRVICEFREKLLNVETFGLLFLVFEVVITKRKSPSRDPHRANTLI
jgi:hypothetical protein